MKLLKKIYCRTFQTVFRAAIPFLPYREPKVLSGMDEIPLLLSKLKVDSVLLVTDRFLRASGITSSLEATLCEKNIKLSVYDETRSNPTIDNVEAARDAYIKNGCGAIIAFGGGSSIDCAKAVGARIAYPNKSLKKLEGILRVLRKTPPLIAIPTTAGTGSETTLAAVITDSESHHKYTINSFPLIPSYAVLDPKVTYSLPPHLTATTGMDALTHAVEAYIGRSTTKDTRKAALEATSLIFANIEKAYSDGKDHTARANMLRASYLAGLAFTKSYVGYIHAVAHSLGGRYNIPHGLANSVILPIFLEEYGESAYKKLHDLAVAAGVAPKEVSHKEGAERFITAIKELLKRMDIPEKLEGIKSEDVSAMAKYADKEANPLYPVPRLMDKSELERIYYKIGTK